MVGITFRNAELVGTNLSSSNMRNANFRGADPCGADLSSSVLRNVDFRRFASLGRQTNLTLADLSSSGGCGTLQTNGRTIFCRTTMCDGSVRNDGCPAGVDPERMCCGECSNGVQCTVGVCADCGKVQLIAGPPAQAIYTFQKPAGIAQLIGTLSENADTVLPPLIVGTTDAVVATSTKIDQSKPTRVGFQLTDSTEAVSVCKSDF